jgi:dephospho-CoA kinase
MPTRKNKFKFRSPRNWGCVIGLSGGLGSGKTTVLKEFKRLGAFTLDADQIVHELYRTKRISGAIKKIFGKNVFDRHGSIRRNCMASEIFSDAKMRMKLESIVHPGVCKSMRSQLRAKKGKLAVCDIPLLFETHLNNGFDRIVVVDAPIQTRIKRLRRRGWSPTEIRRRTDAQWPLKKKIKQADYVIDNSKKISHAKNQVRKIFNEIIDKTGLNH